MTSRKSLIAQMDEDHRTAKLQHPRRLKERLEVDRSSACLLAGNDTAFPSTLTRDVQ